MPKPARAASPRPQAPGGRRHKRRQIELPAGDTLVLNSDLSIDHLAADGSPMKTWRPADPEWASHAIRFGLREQAVTVPPSGRSVRGTKPPRR